MRGRLGIPLDNLGGVAAGRLPSGFISGSVLGSTGGADANTLVTGNLPAYTPAGTITNGAITVSLSPAVQVVAGGGAYCPGGGTFGNPTTLSASASQAASTFAGTAQGGSSTPFSNLQPSVMITKLLVVE
jgi:microcystin-dependent protein